MRVCVFAAEDEESTIEEQEAMEVPAEQKEELVELTKEGQRPLSHNYPKHFFFLYLNSFYGTCVQIHFKC